VFDLGFGYGYGYGWALFVYEHCRLVLSLFSFVNEEGRVVGGRVRRLRNLVSER
jgi:hypothetical protein